MKDVILHAFNWHYNKIAECAEKIAEYGYGAVLFPPPIYSNEKGEEWWQRYQPKDYRIVRSFLGGKKELKNAIDALHKFGIKAYTDVVFNHMANEKSSRGDYYNFPGEIELIRYNDENNEFENDRLYGDLSTGLFCHLDFNPHGDIYNWNNIIESQEKWLSGLPDLDLNDWVVKQQQLCLIALNNLGFDGYRIDAIKHLPLEHIQRVFQIPEMSGEYIFAEALTCNDNEENIFLWPLVDSTEISYYDFPLHETLRRVFSYNGTMRELANPEYYKQSLPWHRAVTFTVTHDIPNNDGFRWQLLDPHDEYLANIYILCRDGGVPLVYSDHNESSKQYSDDHHRWCNSWCREDTVNMIRFHNAVHGMPQKILFEHDGYIVFSRGDKGLVAINKTMEWHYPVINTGELNKGTYFCQIHKTKLDLINDETAIAIPPRQAHIWLYNG